jgi:double-stranded uracil-DNA glycosylase
MIIQGFDPIADSDARILILGSVPGIASLEASQYYGHPRNAFWRIMGDVFGAGLERPYAERTAILKDRGVAVWDVLKLCHREGSLDSNIKDEVPNDFVTFFEAHRRIDRVVLNGGKAAKSFEKHARPVRPAIKAKAAPSTSPAYASLGYERKLLMWREALLG